MSRMLLDGFFDGVQDGKKWRVYLKPFSCGPPTWHTHIHTIHTYTNTHTPTITSGKNATRSFRLIIIEPSGVQCPPGPIVHQYLGCICISVELSVSDSLLRKCICICLNLGARPPARNPNVRRSIMLTVGLFPVFFKYLSHRQRRLRCG